MFGGSFKEAVRRDPLVRLFRRITAAPDPAQWNYKQGRKYLDYYGKKFNYSLGVAHLKEAVKLVPDSALFHASLGEALLSAPAMAVIRGITAEFALSRAAELALPELQKASRLETSFPMPYYFLVVCYEYLGQLDKSELVCRQAMAQSFPDDVKKMFKAYLEALAAAHERVRNVEAARKLEEECLARIHKVLAYRDNRKYKEAEKELQAAGKSSPSGAWMYSALCRLGSSTS